MPDVRDVRTKVKIAIAALLAVDIVAGLVLLSPLVGSERSRREQLDQLWRELQQKTREAEPLRDVDQKIVTARRQIDDFYKNRLPAQDSAISEELGKVAGQNKVHIGQIRYQSKDNDVVGLRPVEIQAEFSGDYLQLVRFINALERDRLFFIIDSVELGGEQGGLVKLQLKLKPIRRRVLDAVGDGKPEQDDRSHRPDGLGAGVYRVAFLSRLPGLSEISCSGSGGADGLTPAGRPQNRVRQKSGHQPGAFARPDSPLRLAEGQRGYPVSRRGTQHFSS